MRTLTFLIAFTASTALLAQDAIFQQYERVPLNLNPGLAGVEAGTIVSLATYDQWPSAPASYVTNAVSILYRGESAPIGAGLMVFDDNAGAGTTVTRKLNLSLSYGVTVTEGHDIRLGLNTELRSRQVNSGTLILPDGETLVTVPSRHVALGAGLVYTTSKTVAGLSIFSLNEPNESVLEGGSARLPMRVNAHVARDFVLVQDVEDGVLWSIKPHAGYFRQNVFAFSWVGAKVKYKRASAGVRANVNADDIPAWGFSASAGVWRGELEYAYGSWDMPFATGGAHSISLSFPIQRRSQSDLEGGNAPPQEGSAPAQE